MDNFLTFHHRKDHYRFKFSTFARINDIARRALSSHPKIIMWTSVTDLSFHFPNDSLDGLHYNDGTTNRHAFMVC